MGNWFDQNLANHGAARKQGKKGSAEYTRTESFKTELDDLRLKNRTAWVRWGSDAKKIEQLQTDNERLKNALEAMVDQQNKWVSLGRIEITATYIMATEALDRYKRAQKTRT